MMVRASTLEDLAEIERIENEVFTGDRLSRRSLRRFIVNSGSLMLTLTAQGAIVGYSLVGLRAGSTKARLYSIALDPAQKGRGLGRLLLRASERAASAHGATMLRLEVRADNVEAIRLYEKNGYKPFGRYEEYYEDGGEAIRFAKTLAHDDHG